MSDPADIDDRLEAAAVKAEGGSEIMRRFANDPAGTMIPTESGPLPSIKEWVAQKDEEFALGARFCGVVSVAPTTRLDGSSLQEGDEYQNTVDHLRYNWTGTAWVALNQSAQALRVELADPVVGGQIVAFGREHPSSFTMGTVSKALGVTWISIYEHEDQITTKPDPDDYKTWHWTPAIQSAIDTAKELGDVSYGGFGVSLPAGVFPVTRLIHRSGVSLRGMGSRSTVITALPFDPADGKPYGMLEIDNGPVQGAHITGINFMGSATPQYGFGVVNPLQWGFYCHAKYDAGNIQGGFWHSNLLDVTFWNFNKGIWSRAGYTHANSRRPNQWIDFSGVQVVVHDGGTPWLFTGQHGQITVRGGHGEGLSPSARALYSVKVTFDPDPSTTAYNGINGESTADLPGVGDANRAGHGISFSDWYSFQRSRKGLWVVGPARNIDADDCWFETLAEAVTAEGDCDVTLTKNRFANAAIGTTAGGLAGSGYILLQGEDSHVKFGHGNSIEGAFDHLVSPDSAGANECRGTEYDGCLRISSNGTDILPTRAQKSPTVDATGAIDMGSHLFGTVTPNADHSIKLDTIISNALPGRKMVLRAASGAVTLQNSAGGNIVTGTGKDMTIPSGGIAELLRIQPYVAGSEFLLLSVSTHYATAEPDDGFYYAQGHIVENPVTASGSPNRWECKTAGLAGDTAVFEPGYMVDDYRKIDVIPALTFSTPGDLAVTYSARTLKGSKTGRTVSLMLRLDLSAFTYLTAAGTLTITGLPYAPAATTIGSVRFGGITKAGYTQLELQIAGGSTSATLVASGMGVAPSTVVAADVPSGGAVTIWASITYDV